MTLHSPATCGSRPIKGWGQGEGAGTVIGSPDPDQGAMSVCLKVVVRVRGEAEKGRLYSFVHIVNSL